MSINNLTNLKILEWNANSIRSKIFELYQFMSENKVHITCINETFLSPADILHSHHNFKIYRHDLAVNDDDQRAGGVMIIIHKNVNHTLMPLPRTSILEVITVDIMLESRTRIHSIYLPGGSTNEMINRHYRNDIRLLTSHNNDFIICGDFNSKHRLWNCDRANRAGTILYDEYCSQNFMIFHPTTPTYFSPAANRLPSTIDLVVTNSRYNLTEPLAFTSDSDHEYVVFDLDIGNQDIQNNNRLMPSSLSFIEVS